MDLLKIIKFFSETLIQMQKIQMIIRIIVILIYYQLLYLKLDILYIKKQINLIIHLFQNYP